MKRTCAGLWLVCMVAWTLSAAAGVKWYAVDPMGEVPYMPDKAPYGGKESGECQPQTIQRNDTVGGFVIAEDLSFAMQSE